MHKQLTLLDWPINLRPIIAADWSGSLSHSLGLTAPQGPHTTVLCGGPDLNAVALLVTHSAATLTHEPLGHFQ